MVVLSPRARARSNLSKFYCDDTYFAMAQLEKAERLLGLQVQPTMWSSTGSYVLCLSSSVDKFPQKHQHKLPKFDNLASLAVSVILHDHRSLAYPMGLAKIGPPPKALSLYHNRPVSQSLWHFKVILCVTFITSRLGLGQDTYWNFAASTYLG